MGFMSFSSNVVYPKHTFSVTHDKPHLFQHLTLFYWAIIHTADLIHTCQSLVLDWSVFLAGGPDSELLAGAHEEQGALHCLLLLPLEHLSLLHAPQTSASLGPPGIT